jgi:signal peptidase II
MPGRLRSRWVLAGAIALGVVLLDQLTKRWALSALADGSTISVVWTLQLALHKNTGAAFSMGTDSDLVRFLPVLVLVAVAVIVWRTRAALTWAGAIAVGLIVGGAVGNIIDRAVRTQGGGFFSGGVIDFIDLQWWPVFNVADMGVVVGGILFALVAVGGSAAEPEADTDGGTAPGGDLGTATPPEPTGTGEAHPRLADADSPT